MLNRVLILFYLDIGSKSQITDILEFIFMGLNPFLSGHWFEDYYIMKQYKLNPQSLNPFLSGHWFEEYKDINLHHSTIAS